MCYELQLSSSIGNGLLLWVIQIMYKYSRRNSAYVPIASMTFPSKNLRILYIKYPGPAVIMHEYFPCSWILMMLMLTKILSFV